MLADGSGLFTKVCIVFCCMRTSTLFGLQCYCHLFRGWVCMCERVQWPCERSWVRDGVVALFVA